MLLKNHAVSVLMVLSFGLTSMITPAVGIAGPIPSGTGTHASQRTTDLNRISELLNNPQVREALERAGTDANELQSRLPRMNDHDVHQLSSRMGDVKSGGVIVWVLTVVVLALLGLYLWKRI